jgi:DNA-binding MarR family transcriptional regulator
MYIHIIMDGRNQNTETAMALFPLPCACQNLRRLTRLITRIYDQELRKAGIEVTQFGLLTGLAALGEANQKTLSAGFALDSTTLTRTLALLRREGWIRIKPGKDRRERILRLTEAGRRQLATAQPHWQEAERRLKQTLGERNWKQMQSTISEVTVAAAEA